MHTNDRLERIAALAALTGRRDLTANLEWLALGKNADKWLGSLEKFLAYEAVAKGVEPHPFLPGPMPEEVADGDLLIGTLPDGAQVMMPVEDLSTHLFVPGTTGSGKTFLLAFLAAQLLAMANGPKVLIIDADGHLRELLSASIASGALIPCHYREFRRNLLEPAGGEEPNEAIMRISGGSRGGWYARDGMANLYSQILHKLYGERGVFGGSADYPTLFDLQHELKRMKFRVDSRTAKYWESLVNRADTLVLEMGATYDCVRGFSAEDVLNANLLLDLRGLSAFNLQFFVNDVLAFLTAYKMRHQSPQLTNVIFLDELHRYIPKNLKRDDLAEPLILTIARTMRKFGVGLVLADQVPSEIPSAIMGNMGARLVLRLFNGPCIRTVGASCSLTPEQMAFIPELQPGQGVLHYGAFPKPFLVELPQLQFANIGSSAKVNPLGMFTWTPRGKDEPPSQEAKSGEPTEASDSKTVISKEALDYLEAIAKDEFIPATERDEKLEKSGYKGNSLRTELQLAGLIEIHRFNVGRRGGQIAITEVTRKGWDLLAELKVALKKAAGRGGFKHRYYMHVVKKFCERQYKGCRAEVEEDTGANHWVDVAVYMEGDNGQPQKKLGFEILVAGEEKEVGNLKRCLEAGYDCVSLCCDNVKDLEKVKKMCEEFLAKEDMERIGFEPMSSFFGC